MMNDFLTHFHLQAGIDPERTNYDLIEALFRAWYERQGVFRYSCLRGSGVTRTLIEWAKWIDEPILAIAAERTPWKQAGIEPRSWLASIRGMRPRPELVLIDNPATRNVFESVVMSAKYDEWLWRFPYPAFYVHQR